MSDENQDPWPKIQLSDTIGEIVVKMAQGNPGAVTVMASFIAKDRESGILDILRMDDMGMRGPAIWVGFKDHCGEDLETFRKAIRSREPAMIGTIRRQGCELGPDKFERRR